VLEHRHGPALTLGAPRRAAADEDRHSWAQGVRFTADRGLTGALEDVEDLVGGHRGARAAEGNDPLREEADVEEAAVAGVRLVHRELHRL